MSLDQPPGTAEHATPGASAPPLMSFAPPSAGHAPSAADSGWSAQTMQYPAYPSYAPYAGYYPWYPAYPTYSAYPYSAYPGYGGYASVYPMYSYPPYYFYPVAMAPATNGMAIASLICSCAAFLVMPLPFGILGVIFGHIGLSQIKKSHGYETGDGLAIAGLVIGYGALFIALTIIVFYFVFAVATLSAASQ